MSVNVSGTQTTADVAQAFAAAVNANATLMLTHAATAVGEQVILVKHDGTALSVTDVL